jgi:threonine aldolase
MDNLDLLVALESCERVLWRVRRLPMRTRLQAILDSGYDLDTAQGDDVVRMLEERVATLLGTQEAAFFPTGTMAQQVALRCWAERTGSKTVALHPLAHLEMHERRALTTLTGCAPCTRPVSRARLPPMRSPDWTSRSAP